MSGRRTSFGKLERERARKAKAVAKVEQRLARSRAAGNPDGAEADGSAAALPEQSEESTSELLEMIAELHRRKDAGDLAYEDFEKQNAALLSQIRIN